MSSPSLVLAMVFLLPLCGALAEQRIALITGGNKGIGKEIARKLGAVPMLKTIICSRSPEFGAAAVDELSAAGCDVYCLPLYLTNPSTILAARDHVEREFGRLDILVNNAAVCFNDPTLYGKVPHTPFQQQAALTIETNFFGTLSMTQAFMPLLKASSSPRIINVASSAGRLAILRSEERVAAFTSTDLQLTRLEEMMRTFVHDVEAGVHTQEGWPNTCYGMSKLGIIALTRMLAREEPEIMVNSVDPGYCATDQNMNQGFRSAGQGARTPVMLALRPEAQFLSGKHLYDECREIEW